MNHNNSIISILFFIYFLLITSCASVSIETKELPDAKLNENYLVEIDTAVDFHFNDDYYPRKVEVIEGGASKRIGI